MVEAAAALGLDGLSIRAVAERLGVTGPAIYHYVPNAEELSALVCDRVATRYPLPDPAGISWSAWMSEAAWNLRRMLESTPGMAAHAMRYGTQSPGILRLTEGSLRAARAAGFEPVGAMWVTRAVADFVEAWVARAEAVTATAAALGHTPRAAMGQIVAHDASFGAIQDYLARTADTSEEERFAYTLKLIIDGATGQRPEASIIDGA